MKRYTEDRDGFGFVALTYPFNVKDAIYIGNKSKSIEEYVNYINNNNIEKAEIETTDLKFLKLCPSLKFLRIIVPEDFEEKMDFQGLYDLKHVKLLSLQNISGQKHNITHECNLLNLHGLEDLSIQANKGTLDFNKVNTLKSLSISNYVGTNKDLLELNDLKELDTLTLIQCKTKSLNGLENLRKIQCLYLYYNRSLTDILALGRVSRTLKALRIDMCSKIEDFSVLEKLENLELLQLSGNNKLPDLNFLKNMKSLKTFDFSMNVLDGNLSPCMNIACVYSDKNRKHYNLKDEDLPKGNYFRGNENIEEWRRLE